MSTTQEQAVDYPSLEGQVFIYNLHVAFSHPHSDGGHVAVTPMTLKATNVVQTGDTTWEFNLEGFSQRFNTHYGWSLYLDTPENQVHIATYSKMLEVVAQLQYLTEMQCQKIVKLGKSESETRHPADKGDLAG